MHCLLQHLHCSPSMSTPLRHVRAPPLLGIMAAVATAVIEHYCCTFAITAVHLNADQAAHQHPLPAVSDQCTCTAQLVAHACMDCAAVATSDPAALPEC